jgi:hypothetical protein
MARAVRVGLSLGWSGSLAVQAVPGNGLLEMYMQHRFERPVLAGAPAIRPNCTGGRILTSSNAEHIPLLCSTNRAGIRI